VRATRPASSEGDSTPEAGRRGAWASRRLAGSTSFLALMTAGYAIYAVDRTVLASVLAPLSAALSLSDSQVGLISAAQYIGVTAVVFLAGHLSDRYGRWPVILTGVAVFTSFTWLMGTATSFSQAFVYRLVSGFGEGAFWPVAMASVAGRFVGKKGLALGTFYVGFDAGSIAGVSIGGVAYSVLGGWSDAFYIAPLVGLPVIAGLFFARTSFSSIDGEDVRIRLGGDALQLLRKRNILLIMAFALLATWSAVWQAAFLPYYFFKTMHYTVLSSALLSDLVYLAGGFGKVLIGHASDTRSRPRILAGVTLATFLGYGLFFASISFAAELAGALAMGFFSAGIFPVMQSLMSDSGGGKVGSALGLSTSAQSVATIFGPIITASLFSLGVGSALALDAMIPVGLACLVSFALAEPRRINRSAQASL